MIEIGGKAGFLNETVESFAVGSEIVRQKFERDFAIEPHIFGKKNLAHSARPDLF
jgi:hypothetical protein